MTTLSKKKIKSRRKKYLDKTDAKNHWSNILEEVSCMKIFTSLIAIWIKKKNRLLHAAILILLQSSVAVAQIVTDGTVGAVGNFGVSQALTTGLESIAPDVVIGEDLGTLVGKNLFHSFSEFNIKTGGSATFTADTTPHANIDNVISRVTGNNASNIDGMLRSTIDNANLFFLNPNGVFFGENAQVDVSGAFVVSTADYLKLQDGVEVPVSAVAVDTLMTAPPAAFGFSGAAVGTITFVGNEIVIGEGEAFAVVGSAITIDDASIKAPGGHVHLTSVASTGEVVLDVTDPAAVSDVSGFAELGDFSATGNSELNTDGAGGGRIVIRGDQVLLEDSVISAQTLGDDDGRGVDIVADSVFSLINSIIDTRTYSNSNAGDVAIAADQIYLEGLGAEGGFGIFTGSVRSFLISELWLQLDISHSYVGDLYVYLSDPFGGNITLFEEVGGSGDNFSNTILRDDAAVSIYDGSAPFSDVYRPQDPFSTYIGENPNGEWTLEIYDEYSGDGGSLNIWSLSVNGEVFDSVDVPVTIDSVEPNIVYSTIDVSLGDSEFSAGSITLNSERLDAFGTVALDASSEASVSDINVSASTVTLDGFDASVEINSGIGIFNRISTGGRIVLDGTFYSNNNGLVLEGPDYSIDWEDGLIRGANLFHSFQDFLIDSGETATFYGPEGVSISSILARVTGDRLSSIFGTLRSDISGANLYLFNPNGILFGENASIDLTGSFHVSTANYLGLTSGGVFDITSPANSVLDSSEPDTFGFSDSSIGRILVDGSNLSVLEGQTISLVGGDLRLYSGGLTSESGEINVVSVDSSGEARLNDSSTGFDTTDFTEFGTIVLDDFDLDVRGDLGGDMLVRSSNFTLQNGSNLDATTRGGNPGEFGGTLVVDIYDQLQLLNGGYIDVSTFSDGNGGSANITAGSLTIDRQGSGSVTGIFSQANSGSIGSGGTLDITVTDQLQVLNGGEINLNNFSAGDDGSATITAGSVTIDRQGSAFFTGIRSEAFSTGKGDALDLRVADQLRILNGGQISMSTFSEGVGGSATITVGSVTIDHQNSNSPFTGISSRVHSTGNGGNLNISVADQLRILNGGLISMSTYSAGDGGSALIHAGSLTIDGQGSSNGTGIFSQAASGTGSGGSMDIRVTDQLQLLNGGLISVSTYSLGDAGSALIRAGNLTIDRQGSAYHFTGIASKAEFGSTGNGGTLDIRIDDQLQLLNGGVIDVNTFSAGNGGSALIRAGNLTIDRQGSAFGTGIASEAHSIGNGGTLDILVEDQLQLLNGGVILANTLSAGAAGSALIRAGSLMIDGQGSSDVTGITSETTSTGNGGILSITVEDQLQLVNEGVISTEASSSGNAGSIFINAPEAFEAFLDESGIQINLGSEYASIIGAIESGVDNQSVVILRDGASVSSSTSGTGDAGDIFLGDDSGLLTNLILDGGNLESESESESSGYFTAFIKVLLNISHTYNSDVEAYLTNPDGDWITLFENSGGDGNNFTNTTLSDDAIVSIYEGSAPFTGEYRPKEQLRSLENGELNGEWTLTLVDAAEDDNGTLNSWEITFNSNQTFTNGISQNFGRVEDLSLPESIDSVIETSDVFKTFVPANGNTGAIAINATSSVRLVGDSLITTNAANSNGGAVTIDAGRIMRLEDSRIITNAQVVIPDDLGDETDILDYINYDRGNGGGITIRAGDRFEMKNSELLTESFNRGGNIDVESDLVLIGGSSVITKINGPGILQKKGYPVVFEDRKTKISVGGTFVDVPGEDPDRPFFSGGNILFDSEVFQPSWDSIFDASGLLDILDGDIVATAPNVDLVGSLITLPESLLDANSQLPERCAVKLDGNYSSLIVVGRGGVPLAPGGYIPAYQLSGGDWNEKNEELELAGTGNKKCKNGVN